VKTPGRAAEVETNPLRTPSVARSGPRTSECSFARSVLFTRCPARHKLTHWVRAYTKTCHDTGFGSQGVGGYQGLRTQIVEATNGSAQQQRSWGNWGKFLVGTFEGHEWLRQSAVVTDSSVPLLAQLGHDPRSPLALVLDLQTGEGAVFSLPVRLATHTDTAWTSCTGMSARWDLNKHKIWVCVLFETFLAWLYARNSFDNLPERVELNAPFAMHGHRRMRLIEGATD
jgi:hypothetical protein